MRRQFGRRWAWEWRDIIAQRATSDKDYVSRTGFDQQTGEIYGESS
jgi:hypothetical protein